MCVGVEVEVVVVVAVRGFEVIIKVMQARHRCRLFGGKAIRRCLWSCRCRRWSLTGIWGCRGRVVGFGIVGLVWRLGL